MAYLRRDIGLFLNLKKDFAKLRPFRKCTERLPRTRGKMSKTNPHRPGRAIKKTFILLLILFGAQCSYNSYQSKLYNLAYIASNESSLLRVDPTTGTIPQDTNGRPYSDFYMDLYEFPNNNVDENAGRSGELPIVNVSWYEARDYCESVGKRLCTVYEWRETCYSNGAGKRKTETSSTYEYPYDGEYDPDVCVTETSSVARSGSRPGCTTTSLGERISDMSGNVWEWVDHDFYGQADQFEGQQAMVGGYYFSGSTAKCGLTILTSTNTKSDKIGFRCCRDKDVSN